MLHARYFEQVVQPPSPVYSKLEAINVPLINYLKESFKGALSRRCCCILTKTTQIFNVELFL